LKQGVRGTVKRGSLSVRCKIRYLCYNSNESRNITAHVDAKVSHVMSKLKGSMKRLAAGTKGGGRS